MQPAPLHPPATPRLVVHTIGSVHIPGELVIDRAKTHPSPPYSRPGSAPSAGIASSVSSPRCACSHGVNCTLCCWRRLRSRRRDLHHRAAQHRRRNPTPPIITDCRSQAHCLFKSTDCLSLRDPGRERRGKEPPYTPRYSPIRDISPSLNRVPCSRQISTYSNPRAVAPYPCATGCCKLSPMVDIDLIVQTLRQHGHRVGSVIPVPDNAGEYEARHRRNRSHPRRSPRASGTRRSKVSHVPGRHRAWVRLRVAHSLQSHRKGWDVNSPTQTPEAGAPYLDSEMWASCEARAHSSHEPQGLVL